MSGNKSTEKSTALVKSAFREYYFKYAMLLEIPEHIDQREFGYMPFGSGMIRHLSFRNRGDILATLIQVVPADVYCSNAYYRFPTYPMQEKQWLGADLIFDIDAKDLHLPCELGHSYFICARCSEVSSAKSEICESCKSTTLNQTSIPCDKCIFALKKEVKRLITVLTTDLGIEEKSVSVYFSGNNGFHVVVSDKSFNPLDSIARSDVVSYLAGTNIMTESIGVRKSRDHSGNDFLIKFPKSGLSYGWRKVIADKLAIDQSSVVKLSHIVLRDGGYEGFKSELSKMAKTLGVRIDPQVSMDVHRIFRMPGTINSKSGLVKMKCNDFESFDPLYDSCLLGGREGEVKMKVSSQINFKLKGESFRLKEKILKLPLFAAVYLICKGLAEATD
ncbi:MAG: DNA primase [Candidatus Nitrosopolaris wilkensis]|nr:MAG: DNA primase [Candidatus Nitrosopolaris wilkensis]